jgi:hypothetical protein
MTAKTLKYTHSNVCGVVAAKAKPKPKPKPTEVREEVIEDTTQPKVAYHDIVKQRAQHLRELREHRIKSLFSKAI